MNAKQLRERLEAMGFGIAHVRRVPRGTELRAYIAVRHEDYPAVDEVRYNPRLDFTVSLYAHATKPNGYTQYDKYLGDLALV